MSSQISRRSDDAFFKPKREFKERFPNGFPVGKRTKRRQSENRKLNARHQIKECEIRIQGICVRHIMLTWAHALKSRFILNDKDWQEAARCCLPCHDHIEALSHAGMARLVREAIAKRTVA